MASSDETNLTLVTRNFVNTFGTNGTLRREDILKFLSILRMDILFVHLLPNRESCPSHNFSSNEWYNGDRSPAELMSAIWETVQTPDCYIREGGLLAVDNTTSMDFYGENTPAQVWGYGLLCVTIINLCSLLGIAFTPMMRKSFYHLMLTFMTALAVGSLIATALLILLPDALQLAVLHEEANSDVSVIRRFATNRAEKDAWAQFLTERPWYIWRCCGAFGGIYLFFVLERMLKELLGLRQSKNSEHNGHLHGNIELAKTATEEQQLNHSQPHSNRHSTSIALTDSSSEVHRPEESNKKLERRSSSNRDIRGLSLRARLSAVNSVAWMVMLGDSLHNFVDGISLGAAFARSPMTGVSIGLAILCEELPHELGDFAILLTSGMSMPMAATINALSACVCYIGFVIGVLLGEIAGFSVWIFAAGGGMFLYISLVDMMPEVNEAVDSAKEHGQSKWRIFLLQNLGILVGYGLILQIAIFGGDIKF